MRGRGDHGAALSGVLYYRNGESRALGRIRTRAEFVKQQQRALVTLLEYADNIGHMRRKCGEALLYALLVAYVGHNMAEHGHVAAVRCRDMQPALIHCGKKSDGLERNGLTACVRPGDNQRIEAAAKLKVDRHGFALVEQRVSCPAQHNAALFIEPGLLAVELIGQAGLGKYEIKADKHIKVCLDVIPVLRAVGREFGQYALYFKLFLSRKLAQLVIGLDRRHRLDKHGHPGGGHIMHKSRYRSLAFGLDRNDIAVGTHGNYRLLQHLCIAWR